ncbi:putative signal transducing protein [Arenimonas composti]|uniref:DUF2007 domain-containing protein n=1 Tax=Arenimonas composti TR7-09 = DSM 18010 TaxID=1121013 RepID=A0A091BBC6_9GAMM|nr:DUF2007 domain-containing protein [Arenimonas composti]KFN48817.1 hypothetical protein P873_13475 [Arenimonas composti TR7-09 = DSM 18010]
MIAIYTADSLLDAQLVQDLLTSAGIAAHVLGREAALPGETADGRIRVAVEDGEADLAHVMLQEWQTAPEDESFDLDESLKL